MNMRNRRKNLRTVFLFVCVFPCKKNSKLQKWREKKINDSTHYVSACTLYMQFFSRLSSLVYKLNFCRQIFFLCVVSFALFFPALLICVWCVRLCFGPICRLSHIRSFIFIFQSFFFAGALGYSYYIRAQFAFINLEMRNV